MKYQTDFKVIEVEPCGRGYALLKLEGPDDVLSECRPGQFVEIAVAGSRNTFLRRPISINNVIGNRLWLLVKNAGEGTQHLCTSTPGDVFNLLLPLGNGFDYSDNKGGRELLIGGGVGVAPLLWLGKVLSEEGRELVFLLGARTAEDLLLLEEFEKYGKVELSTEDGSMGHKGLVTKHPCLESSYDRIYCCGPLPMMKAVAEISRQRGVECQVSLENKMACGLGACLCCVEDTKEGHKCVCSDGPVFNIDDLKW